MPTGPQHPDTPPRTPSHDLQAELVGRAFLSETEPVDQPQGTIAENHETKHGGQRHADHRDIASKRDREFLQGKNVGEYAGVCVGGVFVGSTPTAMDIASQLQHALQPQTEWRLVDDLLQALGDIATTGKPEAIVVYLDTSSLEREPALANSIAAVRQLAPAARLIAITDDATTQPHNGNRHSPNNGNGNSNSNSNSNSNGHSRRHDHPQLDHAHLFDACFSQPIDWPQLIETLTPHHHAPHTHPTSPTSPAHAGPLHTHPHAHPHAPTHAAPQPQPHQASDASHFGDIDLIDQMMRDHRHLPTMALSMIEAQGGIVGVSLCQPDETDTIPENHSFAPVIYRKHTLGILHAPPPAQLDTLMPWADWIARWLALDRRMTTLWDIAQHDPLTGLWNRRYFSHFLELILTRATTERFQVTLMVFDIDDFKHYNDTYGHPAGDEILKEASSLLRSVVREHDVVARIGGDEFAVIFWDPQGPREPHSTHPTDVRQAAERFRRAICEHKFPKLSAQAPGNLTISGGLASFPWDGRDAEHLIAQADKMAFLSKRQGKNALVFGPGALRGCEQ